MKFLFFIFFYFFLMGLEKPDFLKEKSKENAKEIDSFQQEIKEEREEILEEKTESKKEEFIFPKRNPFFTKKESDFLNEQIAEIFSFDLSAIFYHPKKSYAIINGKILKEKDIIDNKQIVRIEKDKVFLKDFQEKEYLLKLKKIDE